MGCPNYYEILYFGIGIGEAGFEAGHFRFFVEKSESGIHLVRSELDGSKKKTIHSIPLEWEMAVNCSNNRIYYNKFIGGAQHIIGYLDFDGNDTILAVITKDDVKVESDSLTSDWPFLEGVLVAGDWVFIYGGFDRYGYGYRCPVRINTATKQVILPGSSGVDTMATRD